MSSQLVLWTPESKADISRLFEFLRKKNPQAARQAIRAIRQGAKQLAQFAESGRPMDDDSGRRELFVYFGAEGYVLRYMLDGPNPVVIRVFHAREMR